MSQIKNLDSLEEQLEGFLNRFNRVLIAFSGGVDSSCLAFIAHRVLGPDALAVTALSPSVSEWQRQLVDEFIQAHEVQHRYIQTQEFENPSYRANNSDRCYFCKDELYGRLSRLREEFSADAILDGTNRDDLKDYRPGRRAAQEKGVRSPFAELGIDKATIRMLSRRWGLSSAELPAMPCLSSRLPYGLTVTEDRLKEVELAEDYLRRLGLENFRVRHHGNLARLEIERAEVEKILTLAVFDQIVRELQRIGFRHVTLDLKGFQSGSLNAGLKANPRTS